MLFARQSLGSLVPLLFGLLVSIVLARVLGAEARGEYGLAVRLSGLILAVAQWGIPEVLLQALADRRAEPGALVGTSLVLGIAGTLAGAMLIWVAAPFFSTTFLRGVDGLLIAVALVGSLFALVGLFARRYIQLAGRLGVYNVLDLARNAVFLALAVGLSLVLPSAALGAILGWIVAEVLLALAAGGYVLVRLHPRWRFDAGLARSFLLAGAPVQLGIVATFLGNEGGGFILNDRLELAAVGVFGVAASVARLVIQVSMALRTVLQARLTGTAADSADVTERVTRHGLLWMLLVAAALAVGSPLMGAVFGRDFASAGPALLALLPGMIAYGVAQLLAGHLLRIGWRSALAFSSWTFVLASLGLQAFGVAQAGLVGAGIGLSTAYGCMAAIELAAFARATGRSPWRMIPRPSDLQFYVGLGRGLLRGRAAA